jgi:hypothetical protein
VEIGVEAGIEIMKTSFSESVKSILSSSKTETYEKSVARSVEKKSSINNVEIPPGYYQSCLLQVNRTTTTVPFKALEVIKPAGHGSYLSRNEIEGTFTNSEGTSSKAVAGDLMKCRDT